jgi:hypothetical protein
MKFLKRIFIFFNCVLVFEIKNFNIIFDQFLYYLTSFNIFKLLFYKIGFKNINPINLESFKNFINEKKIPIIEKNTKEKDSIILVENFINQPVNTYQNLVSALFLKRIYKFKICGLLRRGDIKAEVLFRKFNINNIIYIDEPNFFNRVKYIIKAISFSSHPLSIKKFCKLKYKDTDIGLSTYDSYIRYKKIPSEKNTNIQILCMLAQSMFKCDQILSRVFSNKKIKKVVQGEIVFSPLQSLFQLSLLHNVEVYSKTGGHKQSIRKYNNTSQIYTYKYNISNKLFNRVYKTKKKQALNLFNKNYLNNLNKDKFGNIDFRMPNIKVEKKLIKKKDIYDYLQMKKKPIVCFFLNHLIDGNFHSGPMVSFQDTLTWFKFVFDEIKKYKKVNWIIKLHPTEKYYRTKFNLISIIKKLEKEYDHIKLYPDELSNLTLLNSVDVALTSHGTVGFEYPAYGIKSIFVNNSQYSNMNFCNMTDTKKKIRKEFENIHLTKKLKKNEIEKYRIYMVLRKLFWYNECSLLPLASIGRDIDERKFWQDCKKLMVRFNFKNDKFYQMLKHQIKYKTRHTYNYNLIKLPKTQMNDFDN